MRIFLEAVNQRLLVTASPMQGDRERAMAGFTAYIAKPSGLSTLRTEIQRLLS